MIMYLDAETIPNFDLPKEIWPKPKYGNTKDEAKRKVIDEKWKADGLIKAMSVNNALAKIVSLQYMIDNEFVSTFENNETNMLKEFWYNVKSVEKIVGYNIFDFDLPLIINRSMLLGVTPSKKLSMQRYRNDPIFDIFQVFIQWGKKEWVGLDWVLQWLRLPTKECSGSEVYSRWVTKQYDWIHNYCRGDIVQLPKVYNLMKDYYK